MHGAHELTNVLQPNHQFLGNESENQSEKKAQLKPCRLTQAGLRYRLDDASVCGDTSQAPGVYISDNMWSPRRNHRSVTIDNRIFVLGGRAREIVDIPRERTVGGILFPRTETDPFYSTWREPSVLKNDVWASDDEGATWFLVTPGCHAPQEEDVLAGNQDQGKHGAFENECSVDSDCYGVGECLDLAGDTSHMTCVCPMWSPRELHAVAAHNGFIFVVGGFVSLRGSNCGDYACGDVDAGAYRGYKSDVWYSSDGEAWNVATLAANWPGRGDHGLFVHDDIIYVVGGATDSRDGSTRFMNDVWHADLPSRYVGACLKQDRCTGIRSAVDTAWCNLFPTPTAPGSVESIHTQGRLVRIQ